MSTKEMIEEFLERGGKIKRLKSVKSSCPYMRWSYQHNKGDKNQNQPEKKRRKR